MKSKNSLKIHDFKMKVRKGDKVLIITGKDRNKSGIIERVIPTKNKVIVTGLNLVKKTLKRSSKNPQGGIIDIPAALNASNVMLLDTASNKPTRVGYKKTNETRSRIAKVSGDEIKEIK